MKLHTLLEAITLNHHQRYVLLQIHLAETPTLAFEQTNNSEADVQSRNILARLGNILLSDSQTRLTPKGKVMLVRYGLVDESDEITDIGREILEQYQ